MIAPSAFILQLFSEAEGILDTPNGSLSLMSWALGLIPKTEYKATPTCSHTALGSLSGLNLHFYSITTGFPAGVLEGGSCLRFLFSVASQGLHMALVL